LRFIKKRRGPSPDCLYDQNASPPVDSSEARRRWSRYDSTVLSDLLLNEQRFLCAYSEIDLHARQTGFHVEHVKPKSRFPWFCFEYSNLVLSALSSDNLGYFKDNIFAGHFKGNNFDKKQFLSPLRSRRSREYFLYLSNGKVVANPSMSKRYQIKAEHTINVLNLNAPCLINWRKRWIDELDTAIDEHLEDGMSVYYLACIDLLPKAGRLSEFFSASKQRFGSVAKAVLSDFRKGGL
jgi:uncharacterized protein (TIGR02646 family)